ncbi:MAG: ligase-associated DNA damage response endonuclease PdeM [Limimaricola sp.]|uniref:ligase-associated DNA damage response endonuclease PdeM n=1 Tax=Limimaricola sp. TaxID=2211665 RepID=UPI001DA4C0E0|nr:ligase-associated DNA damage response endonuclease PdeM [Limimaricola sp.]MBI1415757.1 ligase-associated DNA damage response endonuclease PdeM [Limimaricola sp.]
MNGHDFTLAGVRLTALPSGALWIDQARALCVADLHLGKSDRMARRGGALLPPYETFATLDRLAEDIAATAPEQVICLGDSFDDLIAGVELAEEARLRLMGLQAGRRWIWIEGNHDPGPVDIGGSHLAELALAGLTFRHIAIPNAAAEVSGHYHPKAHLPGAGWRPAFLADAQRVILPAYGTYTGGLRSDAAVLRALMQPPGQAILTGRRALARPL